MVYSCIGAEIEDSDGSGTSDTGVTADAEMSTALSEAPADARSNGHAAPSKPPTDRRTDACRQERIVPLADTRAEPEEDGGGTRLELQSAKPSLAIMSQRHLQESLGNAGRSHLLCAAFQCVIEPKNRSSDSVIRTKLEEWICQGNWQLSLGIGVTNCVRSNNWKCTRRRSDEFLSSRCSTRDVTNLCRREVQEKAEKTDIVIRNIVPKNLCHVDFNRRESGRQGFNWRGPCGMLPERLARFPRM